MADESDELRDLRAEVTLMRERLATMPEFRQCSSCAAYTQVRTRRWRGSNVIPLDPGTQEGIWKCLACDEWSVPDSD